MQMSRRQQSTVETNLLSECENGRQFLNDGVHVAVVIERPNETLEIFIRAAYTLNVTGVVTAAIDVSCVSTQQRHIQTI